ncbi:hypothetical protein EDB84DRAFT_1437440 [Lactarius hengduanensis]|nr:hypothetical protein EDB84DRAFT_1437440 [Lactarius hengduanensis]
MPSSPLAQGSTTLPITYNALSHDPPFMILSTGASMGLKAAMKSIPARFLVRAAFVGYIYSPSTTAKIPLYQLGLTSIQITNANNDCAMWSAAVVPAGNAYFALPFGFERVAPGALGTKTAFPGRPNPVRPLSTAAERASPDPPPICDGRVFQEPERNIWRDRRGLHIVAKDRKHSINNPYARCRTGYDEAAILAPRGY